MSKLACGADFYIRIMSISAVYRARICCGFSPIDFNRKVKMCNQIFVLQILLHIIFKGFSYLHNHFPCVLFRLPLYEPEQKERMAPPVVDSVGPFTRIRIAGKTSLERAADLLEVLEARHVIIH